MERLSWWMEKLAIAIALTGCGIGFKRALVTEEMPTGTCSQVKLDSGESCTPSARDYSAGATIGMPHGHASDVSGTAWFRWPLFDVELDERRMRRGTLEYHSLAGGVGTHLRPMIFWPDVQRYIDPVFDLGFDLGALKKDSHFEGRGDGYLAGAIELYTPDFGPFRYLDNGVPGIRIGVRYTGYVQGWESDTTVEVGLIWRWGIPIDMYTHWTMQRTGD